MELLCEIDWTYIKPNCQTFVEDDSYEKSCMFRSLDGRFKNPLLLEEEDSSTRCPSEGLTQTISPSPRKPDWSFLKENEKKGKPKNEKPKENQSGNIKNKNKLERYVPGLRKLPMFARTSNLLKSQQELCKKVLLSLHNLCIRMPTVSVTKNEIDCYNNLIPIIVEEQKQFLEYVKHMWITNGCIQHLTLHPDFDTIKIKNKTAYQKYPQYYEFTSMFPLVFSDTNIPIELKLIKNIATLGESISFSLPSLTRRCVLPTKMMKNIISEKYNGLEKSPLVSEDSRCEQYAMDNNANIVISSSGLKILANNQQPFKETWNLPVFIKKYDIKDSSGKIITKKIVYIDRALPTPNETVHQKTQWFYKLLTKHYFSRVLQEINYIDRDNVEENYSLESTRDELNFSSPVNNNSEISDSDEDKLVINETGRITRSIYRKLHSTETNITPNSTNLHSSPSKKKNKCQKHGKRVTYSIWKLGQSNEKNILSKDNKDDIVMLVRCKQDGSMITEDNVRQNVELITKLDHQGEFGAESVTPTEAVHQWTLLKFRPDSNLLRVRIVPRNGEIIMLEKLTLPKANSEALKSTSWKPDNALGCYFSIFTHLLKLPPGQYILNHEPKHHAFASLYSCSQKMVKDGLDLEKTYNNPNVLSVNQNNFWIPIDTLKLTPNLLFHNLLPCIFPCTKNQVNTKYCKNIKSIKKSVKNKKKKKKKTTNKND